jgi:hypothetical protein
MQRRLWDKWVEVRRFAYEPDCQHHLQYNRGTKVPKKYGIEAAEVTFGHAKVDATEVYAEKNLEQAIRIARQTG